MCWHVFCYSLQNSQNNVFIKLVVILELWQYDDDRYKVRVVYYDIRIKSTKNRIYILLSEMHTVKYEFFQNPNNSVVRSIFQITANNKYNIYNNNPYNLTVIIYIYTIIFSRYHIYKFVYYVLFSFSKMSSNNNTNEWLKHG